MDIATIEDRKKLYVLLGLLSQSNPIPLIDETLLNLMQDRYKKDFFSLMEIRKMLSFLHGCKLCMVQWVGKEDIWDVDQSTKWIAVISAQGVQYLAGFGDDINGIHRPKKDT